MPASAAISAAPGGCSISSFPIIRGGASLVALSVAIYLNFFSHHYIVDLRWLLFAWAGWLFFRTRVYFRVWHDRRSMPLLLGLVLVSVFIWFSENIGTFTKTWLYPSQRHGWSMVSIDKLGSWFLLLIISYTLVSLVNAPRERRGEEHAARGLAALRARTGCRHRPRVEMRLRRRRRTEPASPTPLLLAGQNALPQRGNAALRLRRDQAVALIVEAAELGRCVGPRARRPR